MGTYEAAGLVTVRRAGNQKRYQANHATPIFSELRGMAMKTFGVADVSRAALQSLQEGVQLAFAYGALAKGLRLPDQAHKTS